MCSVQYPWGVQHNGCSIGECGSVHKVSSMGIGLRRVWRAAASRQWEEGEELEDLANPPTLKEQTFRA